MPAKRSQPKTARVEVDADSHWQPGGAEAERGAAASTEHVEGARRRTSTLRRQGRSDRADAAWTPRNCGGVKRVPRWAHFALGGAAPPRRLQRRWGG